MILCECHGHGPIVTAYYRSRLKVLAQLHFFKCVGAHDLNFISKYSEKKLS